MGDTAGQGLSYVAAKANIKVTNKDESVVLKENTDYKIQNSENGFVIDFIVNNGQVSDTVASLHGQDLQMTYNMYVNDSAAVANPLTNSVDFVYNKNPFNQEEHHEKTKADVVTYGAKFLKSIADYLEQESKQHRLKAQNLLLKTQKENIMVD